MLKAAKVNRKWNKCFAVNGNLFISLLSSSTVTFYWSRIPLHWFCTLRTFLFDRINVIPTQSTITMRNSKVGVGSRLSCTICGLLTTFLLLGTTLSSWSADTEHFCSGPLGWLLGNFLHLSFSQEIKSCEMGPLRDLKLL